MEEIDRISEEALTRYFKTLGILGYKSYDEVNKLILLLFLNKMLSYGFDEFIDDEDYTAIHKALTCLFGSTCLIDYPDYKTYDNLVHNIKVNLVPRITEDSIYRIGNEKLRKV